MFEIRHSLGRAFASWPFLIVLTGAMLLPGLVAAAPPAAPGNPAFDNVWERTDYPVSVGTVARSWLWGPRPNHSLMEPNAESPGGLREVQYYDKSRMEINDPRLDQASPWFVTNGLLVVEMISGRLQVGANAFEQRAPALVPVAGDSVTAGPGVVAPTYASLAAVASTVSDENRAPSRIGQPVTATLSADGTVGSLPSGATGSLPRLAYYEPKTGHNIPDVFWGFMNAQGPVYENARYVHAALFDWLYAMGYPVTEPYWIDIKIRSKNVKVVVQAFQRRILTYNPENEPAWRVEMGNVGMQYYEWRYGQSTPGPSPAFSPTPAPGGQTLNMRQVDLPDPFRVRQFAGIHDPLYTIVTGEADWRDLWARYTSEIDPPVPAPAVDFSTEFVAAAFWGDKPSSCYRLDITGVALSANTITVTVDQVVKEGVCATVIVQPNDLQAVSRAGLTSGRYSVVFVDKSGKTLQNGDMTLP